MARRLWNGLCIVLFAIGIASLLLTAYLWVGDWPQQTREIVDHLRSVAENDARGPDPLVVNALGREFRSLEGTWPAVIDPYDRGALAGLAPRDVRPRAPSDLGEFSFEDGLTLEVPGDWNSQDPTLLYYQGPVWYKREFEAEPADGRRAFLYFGAANYRASVYLNGRLLGRHEGGFTPFNFEVTSALRSGANLLVVAVDNRLAPDDVPTPVTDWHNYGGLTRDVLLLDLPATFVRSYRIGLDADGERLVGHVQLDGDAPSTPVRIEIPELEVEASSMPDADGRVEISIEARPERWSPESPRLYEVVIRAGDDRVRDSVGFRTVEAVGNEIHLNGEPVFLRGISIHGEAAHGGGRIHDREQAATLLQWAVDLECNFVRLAHYTHSEWMVREADRLGLMVWSEIPVYWAVDFGNARTLARARTQLSEMIERDANRASVVLWSVANETPLGADRLGFLGELVEHVRETDDSRLVTAALLPESIASFIGFNYLPALFGFSRDRWSMPIADPLGDEIDVPALNQYFGWYYSGALGLLGPFSSHHARRVMLDNMDRIELSGPPGKPLVISEFGAGALSGNHAPEEDLEAYSEEYQALVYRRQIEMLGRQAGLAGMSPWILKDFRSPLRLYQGVQDHWNRKGLVADDGRRKLAFAVLRDHYRERRRAEAERRASSG